MVLSKLFASALAGVVAFGSFGANSLRADDSTPLPPGDIPVIVDDQGGTILDPGTTGSGNETTGYGKEKTKPSTVIQQQTPVKPSKPTQDLTPVKPSKPTQDLTPVKPSKPTVIVPTKLEKPSVTPQVQVKPSKPTVTQQQQMSPSYQQKKSPW